MKSCPKCLEPLHVSYYDDVKTWECGRCCGLWMKEGKVRGLAHQAVHGTPAWTAVGAEFELGEPIEAFLCPSCHKPTLEKGSIGERWLSHCRRCDGIWLEHRGLVTGEKNLADKMLELHSWNVLP